MCDHTYTEKGQNNIKRDLLKVSSLQRKALKQLQNPSSLNLVVESLLQYCRNIYHREVHVVIIFTGRDKFVFEDPSSSNLLVESLPQYCRNISHREEGQSTCLGFLHS
uniref:Uncharacterized protein n=1 Tax=Salix viminalis TaxID=40686 RepID=A0A6N2LX93_SALVM